MAKYSPKENSYKEMYLINKFQKDIMETSLQKLKNNKKDTIESLVSSNNSNSDEHKGILENKDQKVSQPFITVQNDNVTDPVNDPEAINLSIENETPNNSTPLDRDNILEKRANPNTSKNDFSLSPSSFQRILDTEKRAINKIKKISKNEKKLNGIKSAKSSDKRITRKMAKSTNNITNNKAKKRIVVKNSDKAISITPLTKKKGEQKQKCRRSVSWLEHLVLSNK